MPSDVHADLRMCYRMPPTRQHPPHQTLPCLTHHHSWPPAATDPAGYAPCRRCCRWPILPQPGASAVPCSWTGLAIRQRTSSGLPICHMRARLRWSRQPRRTRPRTRRGFGTPLMPVAGSTGHPPPKGHRNSLSKAIVRRRSRALLPAARLWWQPPLGCLWLARSHQRQRVVRKRAFPSERSHPSGVQPRQPLHSSIQPRQMSRSWMCCAPRTTGTRA